MGEMNLPGYIQPELSKDERKALFESLTTDASAHLTICEQLRFIYDTVYYFPEGEIKDDLTEKLLRALLMGKKMNSRLQRYKRETGDKTGSAGSNLARLSNTAERKKLRKGRS